MVIFKNKSVPFFIWSFSAAFLAYASMYAFRKPFNAATFSNQFVFGLHFKDLLIISQAVGYMLSKFIGIKVISELAKNNRVRLILSLILIAEVSLLFFALVPLEYKFIFLFTNGLPLGMVWGVIFSFLEGRKLTEMIATGIAIGALVSSGVLKSIALYVLSNTILPVSENWMPFVVGALFIPVLLVSVWMLSRIPEVSESDTLQKTTRRPMTKKERRRIIKAFLPGIISLVSLYVLLTVFRDFRDNFAVEILKFYDFSAPSNFAYSEIIISVLILIATSLIVLFRSNRLAFFYCFGLIFFGFLIMLTALLLFMSDAIQGFEFMLLTGLGMGLGYVPYQIALFERFLAVFRIKGNVGFLMYLSDSFGYLGSIALILFKNSGGLAIGEHVIFESLVIYCSILGLILTAYAAFYFRKKLKV